MNKTIVPRMRPDQMRVTHSVHRQEIMPFDAAWPMKPPMTGPRIGPQNAAFAKTGKTKVLSEAVHMSEILPPAQTSGVAPKSPARKRKANWAPILGA